MCFLPQTGDVLVIRVGVTRVHGSMGFKLFILASLNVFSSVRVVSKLQSRTEASVAEEPHYPPCVFL